MERPAPIETLDDVRNGGHCLVAFCRHTNCRHKKDVDVHRLIQRVGARQMLVPYRAELHFSDKMRCPSCKRMGMNLWLVPAPPRVKLFASVEPPKQSNFTVVDCGRAPHTGDEVIATSDNLMVGRGAYAAAALFYPDRRILMKQGAFLMEDSKSGAPLRIMTAEDFANMREAEAWLGDPMRITKTDVPKAS